MNYAIDHQRILITMCLLQAVEDSDYTKKHSLRVGRLVKKLCEELNVSKQTKKILTRAAYFHDVGKIKLNKNILFKVDKLTDNEYEEMKLHSQYGHDILKSLRLDQEAEIVLQHHERLDGSGYPKGLKGSEINGLTQILSVADVYDAITTERPYKSKQFPEDTLLYLYSVTRKHFELFIVQALHRVLEQNRQFKKTIDI